METDVIVFLINVVLILWLGAGAALALAKGLPLATETINEFKRLVHELIPPLRRMFDPNTALSKALAAKGVNPELADKAAEFGADLIEVLLGQAPPLETFPVAVDGPDIKGIAES